MWDLRNGYCVATSPYHSACSTLRFTVDGALVVSGHLDGTLRFWDVRMGKVAHELTGLHTANITSVAIGRNGGWSPGWLVTVAASKGEKGCQT
jgi:autophagy-related protein 16-1